MHRFGFDIAAIGTLLLIVYIIFDLIRNKTTNLPKRLVLYSFIFYSIIVFQLTTGGINIPPVVLVGVRFQLVPFSFVNDLIAIYQGGGPNWHFWNSVKLSFYNLIMLFPLGIYFPVLYNVKKIKRVILYTLIISLSIEVYQTIFTYFGLTMFRQFNVDDILLNTLGAVVGYYFYRLGRMSPFLFG